MSMIETIGFGFLFLVMLQLPIAAIIGTHLEQFEASYMKRMVMGFIGGSSFILGVGFVLGVML
jgi:hypothetical protein